MGKPIVTAGATMMCSFGLAPSTLGVLPPRPIVEGKPAATITDITPGVNIPPFGMCTSLVNPMVAAATAAALGVLTPMPCVPTAVGPWKPPAAQTTFNKSPALTLRRNLPVRLCRGHHDYGPRWDYFHGWMSRCRPPNEPKVTVIGLNHAFGHRIPLASRLRMATTQAFGRMGLIGPTGLA